MKQINCKIVVEQWEIHSHFGGEVHKQTDFAIFDGKAAMDFFQPPTRKTCVLSQNHIY